MFNVHYAYLFSLSQTMLLCLFFLFNSIFSSIHSFDSSSFGAYYTFQCNRDETRRNRLYTLLYGLVELSQFPTYKYITISQTIHNTEPLPCGTRYFLLLLHISLLSVFGRLSPILLVFQMNNEQNIYIHTSNTISAEPLCVVHETRLSDICT